MMLRGRGATRAARCFSAFVPIIGVACIDVRSGQGQRFQVDKLIFSSRCVLLKLDVRAVGGACVDLIYTGGNAYLLPRPAELQELRVYSVAGARVLGGTFGWLLS